jgi:hypothetical protein
MIDIFDFDMIITTEIPVRGFVVTYIIVLEFTI